MNAELEKVLVTPEMFVELEAKVQELKNDDYEVITDSHNEDSNVPIRRVYMYKCGVFALIKQLIFFDLGRRDDVEIMFLTNEEIQMLAKHRE